MWVKTTKQKNKITKRLYIEIYKIKNKINKKHYFNSNTFTVVGRCMYVFINNNNI